MNTTMRKAIVVIGIAILIYLVFFTDSTCWSLGWGHFESIEEKTAVDLLPMSETEPGLSHQYRTTISFEKGQFIQQESDYFYTGPYLCRFGTVVAHPSSGGTLSGIYNPLTGILLWGGERYRKTLHP